MAAGEAPTGNSVVAATPPKAVDDFAVKASEDDGPSNSANPVANSGFGGLAGLPPSVSAALQDEIMSHVETILAQKEESLWRRGQAELGKLQQERNQVASCLSDLQERQETLVKEHAAMRGALEEITDKLHFLATEVREALRSFPRANCSATAPTPVGLADDSLAVHATAPAPAPDVVAAAAALLNVGVPEAGPQTPPRGYMPLTSPFPMSPGLMLPELPSIPPVTPAAPSTVAPGSPAVLLSLASALPSTSAPPVPATPPPPGLAAPTGHQEAAPGLSAAPGLLAAPGLPAAPGLSAAPALSTPSSVKRLQIAECLDLSAASPPPGGKELRAEAPEFVPGVPVISSDQVAAGALPALAPSIGAATNPSAPLAFDGSGGGGGGPDVARIISLNECG